MIREKTNILCIKDVSFDGNIRFVRGKIYKGKKINKWRIFGTFDAINEEGEYHSIGYSFKWFREHFRILHFWNVKEKKKLQKHDSDILDMMTVTLKLLDCSIEEHFSRVSFSKYVQVYSVEKDNKKKIISIEFDKKMNIKEIKIVSLFSRARSIFFNLQDMYNSIVSSF